MSAALVRAAMLAAIFGAGCGVLDDGSVDTGAGTPAPYASMPATGDATGASNGGTSAAPSRSQGSAEPTVVPIELHEGAVLTFLEKQCRTCHGAKYGRPDAAWPMPEVLTREWLESTESTAVVYELMRRKVLAYPATDYPMPMPDAALDDTQKQMLAGVVHWFERNLPFSVADADVVFRRKPNALPRPAISFQCNAPATLQTFVARFTNQAFGRAPNAQELALFSAGQLAAPVTPKQRALLVARLGNESKAEFATTGLAKLANGILTSGTLPMPSGVGFDGPPDQTFAGATDELHQLFAAHYDEWDYPRYFTENVVMATSATAPIYGCSVASGVAECKLTAPRAGFFSTLGYLETMPQSFMRLENNTRRYVGMQVTLTGEPGPRAGRVGPTSSPPPSCVDDADQRYEANNAFGGIGTWSQLMTGQSCESCHMRGMTAATTLFRPFASSGRIYDPAQLGASGTPDAADFVTATGPAFDRADATGTGRLPIDGAYLAKILGSRNACVATGDPTQPYLVVNDLNDLARHMMRDSDSVLRGFVRHAHRVFSAGTGAPPFPTLEMEARALMSSDSGKSKVPDLVAAYFGSDSFSCSEAL